MSQSVPMSQSPCPILRPTEKGGVICPGGESDRRAKLETKNLCGKSLHSAPRIILNYREVRAVMILANRRRRPGPGSTISFKYLALPTPGTHLRQKASIMPARPLMPLDIIGDYVSFPQTKSEEPNDQDVV